MGFVSSTLCSDKLGSGSTAMGHMCHFSGWSLANFNSSAKPRSCHHLIIWWVFTIRRVLRIYETKILNRWVSFQTYFEIWSNSCWCMDWTILKSAFASSCKTVSHPFGPWKSLRKLLAMNLGKLLWWGCSSVCPTTVASWWSRCSNPALRSVLLNLWASSRISSPSILSCEASYKPNNPLMSLLRFCLNFPSLFLKLLNTSIHKQ